MEAGHLDLTELLETLRIYQSELELQNRELRDYQALNQRLLDNYAAFLGGLPIAALVVDRYGLILQANREAEARFGFRLQSSRHMLLRRLVHPQDEPKLNLALLQAEAKGQASLYQITLLSGGERTESFPAELHIARLPGREERPCEFSCAVVDLTEQMRHEEALRIAHVQLREQETCYRIAADHSPDWDYWYHPEGRYVYVSPGCQDISGFPPQAFKDDPQLMERLLIPEHVERWQRHLQEVHEGCESSHVSMEFSIRRADGELRHIEHQCQGIVDKDGTYLGRRGVNRDITARKKAEAQVTQLTRLYSTRAAVNQAITRLEDEIRLLKTTARIAVEQGGFSACVFTARARPGQTPRIWASHGLTATQLADIPLETLWESIRKQPWHFINEQPLICSDCKEHAPHVPDRWRSWAIERRIHSCGHFPVFVGDELLAVASFLAGEPEHFTPQITDLLKGVVEDLSHALRQMARERQRKAKEAEFQKQESEARAFAQGIIDSLSANICVLDMSGTIVAVNRSWREYGRKGQAPEDRISQGINYLDVCDRAAARGIADAARIAAGIRGVIAGDLEVYEDEYRIDPQTHRIRVTPLKAVAEQQRHHLVISHLDITDIKRNETALVEAKEEAERASRAKSEFLSSMSHELRTPMNAVLGFAQLLEIDPGLNPEQQEHVQEILRGGRHLLQLINQVLDLATVEAGRVELSLENVPLRELVDECIMLVRPLAQEHQIRIQSRCPSRCVAFADRMRFKQILINLLSNGIKYNRHAGLLEICGEEHPRDGTITVSVTDTGRGIPPDRLAELFEPFNRLDADVLETEGTGIGLAISRRLAEVMGGDIEVDSLPDKGSTFRVRLPRGEWNDDSDGSSPDTRPHPVPDREHAPRTILHIDDNPANIRLVAQILRRHGHLRLLNSPNPRFGLELAGAHQPDLILLDINMPDLDGYQVLKRLRAAPATADIPVIALTAFATRRDMERGHSEGFDAYLTKPLDVPRFLQILEKLLAQSPDEASGPAAPRH
ncbi:ATP-binding protein [Ectothiorhodospira shaposhnikovii]|uniref:ATP-binding protein n=1 Tax=Ectothiorhodospira shaposhnikovii TaxID=1054 RepID=UPI0039A107A5